MVERYPHEFSYEELYAEKETYGHRFYYFNFAVSRVHKIRNAFECVPQFWIIHTYFLILQSTKKKFGIVPQLSPLFLIVSAFCKDAFDAEFHCNKTALKTLRTVHALSR